MLQLYIDLALSRLARHAIQPIQLYSYTAIQLYTLYSIQHHTASLSLHALGALAERDEYALALLIRAHLRACLWHLLRSLWRGRIGPRPAERHRAP